MEFPFPYYRDAGQLPGPLPDQNEIEQETKTISRDSVFGARIVLIRDTYVVKYGSHVNENEGHALLFIEKELRIPAPRLYAMYRHQNDVYIVMEYMPGISLGSAWPLLTTTNKDSIARELRCIFDQIRSLPSRGFYGSLNRGPVPHRYFYSREKDPHITGPFETAEEFAKAIALRSNSMWTESNTRSFLSDYLGRHLPRALGNYPAVFTHGDLWRENIMVKKVVSSVTNEDVYEVAALIDWETAGWYPSYWEYAHIFPLLQWTDDWPEYVERVIDPLPLEGAMMRIVFSDLEF
ncbi:phosphotransferase enzyme family protein [Penicillium angulare]|uniref:Phosphotransferase enzyme family protein n=1 Tax=Penicillium angulare TaxID=116970 RepID=A0A9W9K0E2_9EURO|nr:phosphotransferase enzyme family protein [Penicillium angulare]